MSISSYLQMDEHHHKDRSYWKNEGTRIGIWASSAEYTSTCGKQFHVKWKCCLTYGPKVLGKNSPGCNEMHVMKQGMKMKCHHSCHLNEQCKSFWFLLRKMSYIINLCRGAFTGWANVETRYYRDQNISKLTIYRTIKDCLEWISCVNLP